MASEITVRDATFSPASTGEETEATAASVFSLMYRFHASTLDLLSIQLLVHSSMAMAIRAHTPSMIS